MQVRCRLNECEGRLGTSPTSMQEPNSQPRSPRVLHSQYSKSKERERLEKRSTLPFFSITIHTKTSVTYTSPTWHAASLPSCDRQNISVHWLLPVISVTKFRDRGPCTKAISNRILPSRSPWVHLCAPASPLPRMALFPPLV